MVSLCTSTVDTEAPEEVDSCHLRGHMDRWSEVSARRIGDFFFNWKETGWKRLPGGHFCELRMQILWDLTGTGARSPRREEQNA